MRGGGDSFHINPRVLGAFLRGETIRVFKSSFIMLALDF